MLQVGTLSHMPPEMLRFGRMSPAADSYAFGIMLLTLYTGQEAFRWESMGVEVAGVMGAWIG
jgi:serine/threonine protein kinase